NTIAGTLYPAGHAYNAPLLGSEEALTKIAAADLAQFYKAVFQPDHLTVTMAGDITKDRAVAEVQRALGQWKAPPSAAAPAPPPSPPPRSSGERVLLVDRPGLTQSFVSMTLPGVPRLSKDFDAIQVMNTLL